MIAYFGAMIDVWLANGLTFLGILVGGYFAWRSLAKQQAVIHVLVNQRLDNALDKIEALEDTVEALGGEVAPPKRTRRGDDIERSARKT